MTSEQATERFRQALESGYYHRERFPGDREVIMNPAYKTDMYRGKPDKPKRRKLRGLDKYVIFALSVVLIYTIAEFITATITGMEKSTLTVAIYGFWAGEIVTCGLIKIFKLRKGDGNEED